ncbi:MAG: lactonase family protein [Cyanothece sp. SIO1E1]|nr:lactonase family protein [Cyanothece sp. SIO1E1]
MKKLLFTLCILTLNANLFGQSSILYIGTFSERGSEGIYVFEFDQETAETQQIQTLDNLASPSYICLHPNGKYLYSGNRASIVEGENWGSLSAFEIAEDGKIKHLNDASGLDEGTCYISTDHSGQQVYIANYAGGSMAAYQLETDGSIGPLIASYDHQRQNGPVAHAHAAVPSPDNRFLYVPDLGNNEVTTYRILPDAKKLKKSAKRSLVVKEGNGPRHFIFHPNGKWAFVAEELSSSVVSVAYRKNGRLKELDRESTLPKDYEDANKVADIHIHPSGRWLYVSNRGHNSLAMYEVDVNSGMLQPIGHQSTLGDWPRGFMITPNGKFLLVANRRTDNIAIFEIDAATGQLTDTGKQIKIPAPVCLKMKP